MVDGWLDITSLVTSGTKTSTNELAEKLGTQARQRRGAEKLGFRSGGCGRAARVFCDVRRRRVWCAHDAGDEVYADINGWKLVRPASQRRVYPRVD